MIDQELYQRIDRGIAWMDEHAPADWREKIDQKKLNMGDPCNCVVGQVFGDFWEKFKLYTAGEQEQAISLGFTLFLPDEDNQFDWLQLKQAWVKKLQEQQNPEVVPQRRTAEVVTA